MLAFTTWLFLAIGGILLSILCIIVYLQPRRMMHYLRTHAHEVFWFADTKEPVCALTFDDSPTAATEAILDILKEHQVRATFFIIANQVKGKEAILERMVAEGHHLANHLTEDKPSIRYTPLEFETHLLHCDQTLNQFQENTRKKWVRPGSGWFNTEMLATAKKHAYRICLGNCYPHDAQIPFQYVNQYYLKQRTENGSIIILHDRSWTIGVLKQALPTLTKQFQFLSLQELEHYDTKTK